jgi:hypothetical protein
VHSGVDMAEQGGGSVAVRRERFDARKVPFFDQRPIRGHPDRRSQGDDVDSCFEKDALVEGALKIPG